MQASGNDPMEARLEGHVLETREAMAGADGGREVAFRAGATDRGRE